jgi:hypothetical protein
MFILCAAKTLRVPHTVCAPGIRGRSPQPAVAGQCRLHFLYLVFGNMAESALRQSLMMFQGSLLIFVTRSIAAVLVSAWLFVAPIMTLWLRRGHH